MKALFFFTVFFGGALGLISSAFAQTANLSIIPSSITVQPGQTFQITVMVDTGSIAANAVGAYFSYPENLLEGLSIDTTGSILDIITPEKNIGFGQVEFAGAKTPPAFSGSHKIFSATFRAKSGLGNGALEFTTDSAVLSDADSQNILSLPSSRGASIQIVQAQSSPSPSPSAPEVPSLPQVDPEQSGLEIFGVTGEQVNENEIRISWNTNIMADSRVDYGPLGGVYSFSVRGGDFTENHSVLVAGLENGQTYQFRVRSRSESGDIATREGLRVEDLIQSGDVQGENDPANDSLPEEIQGNGFGMNRTTLILFVGLPILVLLVIAVFIIQRMRARRG